MFEEKINVDFDNWWNGCGKFIVDSKSDAREIYFTAWLDGVTHMQEARHLDDLAGATYLETFQ